jgi:hypothetical protein
MVLPRACSLVLWLHPLVSWASIQSPFLSVGGVLLQLFPQFAGSPAASINDRDEYRRLSTSGYRLLELSIFIAALDPAFVFQHSPTTFLHSAFHIYFNHNFVPLNATVSGMRGLLPYHWLPLLLGSKFPASVPYLTSDVCAVASLGKYQTSLRECDKAIDSPDPDVGEGFRWAAMSEAPPCYYRWCRYNNGLHVITHCSQGMAGIASTSRAAARRTVARAACRQKLIQNEFTSQPRTR